MLKPIFFLLLLALMAIHPASHLLGQSAPLEVTFTNGDISLSGTLSFPPSLKKKHPALLLVSGSGPQDRDSDILGFKTFKVLADSLNALGYAVLRYDDRGTGKSTGSSVNESTTADLAEDARAAYHFLRSRDDIDPTGIGILGHSEGGVVVPMVASTEPGVAFVILMAGFGVTGVELSNTQQAAILRSSGMSEDFIEASGKMNRDVFQLMMDGHTTDEELRAFVTTETLKLLSLLPEEVQQTIPDKEGYASLTARQVLQQSASPWVRFYMTYDPLPTLKKVKCPVLLLFGELDTQVLPSQNADLMAMALQEAGNTQVTTVILPGANHLFQEAMTGSPAEYASLKKEFIPSFFKTLHTWLVDVRS